MDQIKWVTMDHKPQTLIFMGMREGYDRADKMAKEDLVDAINRKIAKKHGVEVPQHLIINKKPAKPEKKQEASAPKAKQPRKPAEKRERTPKVNNNTPEKYGFKIGQQVVLLGRVVQEKLILAGRKMQISGASPNEGMILGFLVKESDGSLQKSEITIPVNCIQGYVKQEAAQ